RSWFLSSSSSPNKNKEEEDGLVWERWEIGFKIRSTNHSYPSLSPKNTGQHLLFKPMGYLSAQSDNPSALIEQIPYSVDWVCLRQTRACTSHTSSRYLNPTHVKQLIFQQVCMNITIISTAVKECN
ncbi:hypothetical protein MJO29_013293, partial [Puccinia striiformis f. sp. tritici]